jgi:hypothetical protein
MDGCKEKNKQNHLYSIYPISPNYHIININKRISKEINYIYILGK